MMNSDGLPWLKDLPGGWESSRLKHLVRIEGGGTPSKAEPHYWQGEIPWVSPKDMKSDVISGAVDSISEEAVRQSATQVVPTGSVLIVVRSGILQHSIPVATTAVPVALNQDLKALIPRGSLNAEYLAAVIRGHRDALLLAWRRIGATVDNIDVDILADTPFPVPPVAHQIEIIRYLRHRLREIDDLIAQKERLIELLEEKRTALITRAVTKGLDPNVEMKDSGVEWLREVPRHWTVSPLGRTVKAVSGGTPERGKPEYWNGSIPWVSPKDMKVFELSSAEEAITSTALRTGIKLVHPPAVLLVVRGMILDHSIPVALTAAPLTINQDMKALIPHESNFAEYLVWTLRGLAGGLLAEVNRSGHGTCKLDSDRWKAFLIPNPPENERRAIANHLSSVTTQVDETVVAVAQAIHLLREYRSALISAAVTGKIDVREAAIHE